MGSFSNDPAFFQTESEQLPDLLGESSGMPYQGTHDDLLAFDSPQQYHEGHGQQYDPSFFTQQQYALPAEQQQPFQQDYDQQYANDRFLGGEDSYDQHIYDPTVGAQQDFGPGFYDQQVYPPPPEQQQQQQLYGQRDFRTYQTPAAHGAVQTPKKAPKKSAKKRVSKKTPKKSGEVEFKVTKKTLKKGSKRASKKSLSEPTPSDEEDTYPVSNRVSRKESKRNIREPTPESEDEIIPVSYRAFKNSTSPKKTAKESTSFEEEEEEEEEEKKEEEGEGEEGEEGGGEKEGERKQEEEKEEAETVPIDPRISRKTPKKTVKTPVVYNDGTDYTPITTLSSSPTSASANPNNTVYFPFLSSHLDFVVLRFATVCVGLCRMGNVDEAVLLGQFAIDFFGRELWTIAVEHYIRISRDGDDFTLMKPCMADCIGTFRDFWGKEVAEELQDAVLQCGLWYQRPEK